MSSLLPDTSAKSFFRILLRHRTSILLTLIYAALISFISAHHEVWRDEVRALSIATDSRSLGEMFSALKNEGHPFLWYIILYFSSKIIQAPVVLKIVHILIATIAVYIFLSKAPFKWFQKVLFILGYFPLYEYAVINRHYGLSMLFLFLLCALYSQRFEKSVLLGVVLFLLANTTAHALIIALSVTSVWALEYLISKPLQKSKSNPKEFIIGLTIAVMGIALSIICVLPDKTTAATSIYCLNSSIILRVLIETIKNAVVFPGKLFPILCLDTVILTPCVIWLLYIYLLRKPFILMVFLLSAMGLNLFFSIIYPAWPRHHGYFYLLIVMALWMDNTEKNSGKILYQIPVHIAAFISNFLFILLATLQVLLAHPTVMRDIQEDFSSSKRFGSFIKSHDELKNAILLSEPDFFAEAMPYYVNNLIYIPREKRFGKTAIFTTRSKLIYSLGELLNTAKKLRALHHRPVLFMIAYPLGPEGPFEMLEGFERTFTYSTDSLKLFLKNTKKIADFHQAGDENYDIFLLR